MTAAPTTSAPHRLRGFACCLTGVAFTATIPVFARYSVYDRDVDPLVFIALWLTAAAGWSCLFGVVRDRGALAGAARSWRFLGLVGLAHVGSAFCIFHGVRYLTAPVFALVMSLSIVLSYLVGRFALRERGSALQSAGFVAAVVGLAAFLLTADRGLNQWRGAALVGAGAMFATSIDVAGKLRPARVAPWLFVLARAMVPGVLAMAWVALSGELRWPPWPLVCLIVAGAAIGPFLGWYLYFLSLSDLPLSVACLIRSMHPVLSACFAAIVLGEVLRPLQIPGGLLVVAGIAVLSAGGSRERGAGNR